jgi:hypothetical protein
MQTKRLVSILATLMLAATFALAETDYLALKRIDNIGLGRERLQHLKVTTLDATTFGVGTLAFDSLAGSIIAVDAITVNTNTFVDLEGVHFENQGISNVETANVNHIILDTSQGSFYLGYTDESHGWSWDTIGAGAELMVRSVTNGVYQNYMNFELPATGPEVGIGTANPAHTLDVAGGIRGYMTIETPPAGLAGSINWTQTVARSFYIVGKSQAVTCYLANATTAIVGGTVEFANSGVANLYFLNAGNLKVSTNETGVVGALVVGPNDVVGFRAASTSQWLQRYFTSND